MNTIKLSDHTFERLQKHATPFVDTPESVIKKLLDLVESKTNSTKRGLTLSPHKEKDNLEKVRKRSSRQRGIHVRIGDKNIRSTSLSELYLEALKLLNNKGLFNALKSRLPIVTSKKRYLVSNTPIHPNGKDFVVPVEFNGVYIESHKDYKNGISHLKKLLDEFEIELSIIE